MIISIPQAIISARANALWLSWALILRARLVRIVEITRALAETICRLQPSDYLAVLFGHILEWLRVKLRAGPMRSNPELTERD